MNEKNIIVGLDVGTTKVCTIVGLQHPNQELEIIGIGIFGGFKLDQWLKTGFPVFTVLMSVISVASAIYSAIRGLLKKK